MGKGRKESDGAGWRVVGGLFRLVLQPFVAKGRRVRRGLSVAAAAALAPVCLYLSLAHSQRPHGKFRHRLWREIS